MKLLKDIGSELRMVLTGKTIDAIVPPGVFVFANASLGETYAVAFAVLVSLLFLGLRLRKQQSIWYAVTGLVGTLFAASLAILGGAANFFIPGMISSLAIVVASVVSNVMNRPLTAYISHLTRGWTLGWFWRDDIRPAYVETTWLWAAFFLARFGLQLNAFLSGDVADIAIVNLVLGFPGLIALLVATYAWGLPRLRMLKGPGIDEYDQQLDPPWRGQIKGF
jgi:hypothetical protein